MGLLAALPRKEAQWRIDSRWRKVQSILSLHAQGLVAVGGSPGAVSRSRDGLAVRRVGETTASAAQLDGRDFKTQPMRRFPGLRVTGASCEPPIAPIAPISALAGRATASRGAS